MLKTAFRDNATATAQKSEWFSQFKLGETSVDDHECSGYLSAGCTDENMTKV
jgi:hypothetical protein